MALRHHSGVATGPGRAHSAQRLRRSRWWRRSMHAAGLAAPAGTPRLRKWRTWLAEEIGRARVWRGRRGGWRGHSRSDGGQEIQDLEILGVHSAGMPSPGRGRIAGKFLQKEASWSRIWCDAQRNAASIHLQSAICPPVLPTFQRLPSAHGLSPTLHSTAAWALRVRTGPHLHPIYDRN